MSSMRGATLRVDPPKPVPIDDEFDLQGKLGAFSISDVFQMFTYTEKTGTLTMIQGWNTRTISFERGRIAYVAAGSRLPNISDLLVRNGRISRNVVEQRRRQMSDADLVQLTPPRGPDQ